MRPAASPDPIRIHLLIIRYGPDVLYAMGPQLCMAEELGTSVIKENETAEPSRFGPKTALTPFRGVSFLFGCFSP